MAPHALDFAFWERRLFEELATDPRFEITALIVDGREPAAPASLTARLTDPRLPATILAGLAERIDRAALPPEPTAATPVFETLLATVPRIEVEPKRRLGADQFTATEVAPIRELDLDVILQHAFGPLEGPILTAARHGVWSLHCGDATVDHGAAPGFWESANGEPTTSATLRVLAGDADGDLVVARCWRATEPNAARNRRAILDLSVSLVARELRRLADTGTLTTQPSGLYDGPLNVTPDVGVCLRYLAKRTVNVLGGMKHRIDRMLGRRPFMWQLAVGRGPIEKAALWRTRPIDPPSGRLWADPFLIERDGSTYCFFEEYEYATDRTWIGVGRLEADDFEYLGPAIDTGYHMSFPFVLAHGGDILMIPETASQRRVEVWRAVDFPLRWELHKTVLDGTDVADTVLLERDGAWWMFANISNSSESDHCNELHVFAIDGPELNEVQPHPLNPVVIDARTARNAGRPFIRNGRAYRPSQANKFGIYGFAWNLMEITELTATRYAERITHQARPNFHRGIVATHHFDAAGDVFVIDMCRRFGGRGHWRAEAVTAGGPGSTQKLALEQTATQPCLPELEPRQPLRARERQTARSAV